MDCREHNYVTLKVCICDYSSILREVAAFQRLRSLDKESTFVQQCYFTIQREGESVIHQCFVFELLSLSVATCGDVLFPDGIWDLDFSRRTAREALHQESIAVSQLCRPLILSPMDLRQENFLCDPLIEKFSTVKLTILLQERSRVVPLEIYGTLV